MVGEPVSDFGMLVCGVVVGDGLDDLAGRHGLQADAGRLGNHSARPVRGLPRRLAARQRQNLRHRLCRQRWLAGLARLVAQQPGHSLLGEALLPAPHRRAAHPGPACHLKGRKPVRRKQNNPSPLNVLLQAVPIADNRHQARPVFDPNKDTYGLCHATRIAYSRPAVNQIFVSVH